ncbi:MAG TPA: hypothetical protein VFD85_04460 [Gemmatimonadales bacterium]|nr:hypothetical protein [Gemmatimonadales bacterium]
MARKGILTALIAAGAACHAGPEPAVMPEPGQLARIRHLRIEAPAAACPGKAFAASYDGQLDDGSWLPHRLPVELLRLSSPNAEQFSTGDWTPTPDPLASLTTGFHLVATLRANPDITDTLVIPPEYSCLPRTFRISGAQGNPGASGADGPPITVRIGFIQTPYFATLVAAVVSVPDRPPVYLFADAARVLPGPWLTVESSGGPGGWGRNGRPGRDGAQGSTGCPGAGGGPGENGESGGPGGRGGAGGAITIVGPNDWNLFAGLIDARSPGGTGGRGGAGGEGGQGGAGGLHSGMSAHGFCRDGAAGPPGYDGQKGSDGARGSAGPRSRIVTVPSEDVFGPDAPPLLRSLHKAE